MNPNLPTLRPKQGNLILNYGISFAGIIFFVGNKDGESNISSINVSWRDCHVLSGKHGVTM